MGKEDRQSAIRKLKERAARDESAFGKEMGRIADSITRQGDPPKEPSKDELDK